MLSYTNVNVLPFTEDIPLEVIAFLDPTIEKLCFEQTEGKTFAEMSFAFLIPGRCSSCCGSSE